MPFFGGAKIVWLKAANFLGDTQTGKAQAAVQGFENILDVLEAGLGAEVQFVLSTNVIDKRRTSYKRLSKLANFEIFRQARHQQSRLGRRGDGAGECQGS